MIIINLANNKFGGVIIKLSLLRKKSGVTSWGALESNNGEKTKVPLPGGWNLICVAMPRGGIHPHPTQALYQTSCISRLSNIKFDANSVPIVGSSRLLVTATLLRWWSQRKACQLGVSLWRLLFFFMYTHVRLTWIWFLRSKKRRVIFIQNLFYTRAVCVHFVLMYLQVLL